MSLGNLIFILIFIFAIIVLGVFVYFYFRGEQKKIVSKRGYEEAEMEFYEKKRHLPRTRTEFSEMVLRLLCFYGIFVGVIALYLLIKGIIGGGGIAEIAGLVLLSIVVSPITLLIFPNGVDIFLMPDSQGGVIGYILYIAIFLFGVFAETRRDLIVIYFIFILLLIMNIAGCSQVDLSGLS